MVAPSAAFVICAVIGAVCVTNSIAGDIPEFTVCSSDDFYDAMEKTCAHPPVAGGALKPNVRTLEEFGRLCCEKPCSLRYFIHICEYDDDERRELAYGKQG